MNLFKLLLPSLALFGLQSANGVSFAFNNGFDASEMQLYGSAMLDSSAISLTQDTPFSIGRALYSFKISTKVPNTPLARSFKTSFTFSITPYENKLPGHGLAFIFVPSARIEDAAPAQYLGFLNKSSNNNPDTHVFGVEFDVFRNQEFKDINDNHVSINRGSLFSLTADKAGYWFDKKANNGNETYWSFRELKLNNGEINQAWIEYADYYIKVTMALKK